jgi:DNA-binding Lrp family transcriptional regulator
MYRDFLDKYGKPGSTDKIMSRTDAERKKEMALKEQILRLLVEDGRMSAADIAERLDADEKTIADMIEQLEQNKVIYGYCAMLDEAELPENAVKAIIEVKIRPERDGGFDKIARRLSRFPQVSSLYLMSGGFDLMVEVKG